MANATRPVVEIVSRNVPKRKRSGSEDAQELVAAGTDDAKRWKPDALDGSLGFETKAESPIDQEEAALDSNRVRDAVESQFSLEILLKHEELRLINQELAKCQAALEQLRRCHLIPYPNTQGTPESMYNISNGTGPALRQEYVPPWAAPYGVTDGPYTRHYARWLIPDPIFDGVQDQWYHGFDGSRGGKTVPEGRSTRHSFAEANSAASKARLQRGTAGQKLQALSSGYPMAKEKAGPCVLKRAEDGQMVKLVCNDCQRENFSSTQGFINHCRIAHRKEYKSHEEAAIACGQPIDVDEAGGVVGEDKSAVTSTGLVHPLVRNAPTDRQAYVALLSRIDASLALFDQGKLPGITTIPGRPNSRPMKADSQTPPAESTPRQSLVPSSDTPYLSRFMQNRGLGCNLAEIVGEAKQRVDFEDYSPSSESEDGDSHPESAPGRFDGADSPLPVMRMPARTAMTQTALGRPGSSKGMDAQNARKPSISPRLSYATAVVNATSTGTHDQRLNRLVDHRDDFDQHDVDGDMDLMGPSLVDLSPNTVASNNAPSLVSDDGEYDDGDDDAESAASEDEEEGSDVAEIDIEEDGDVEKVVPRTVLRNRSGSGARGMRLRKEDKHVTFVSPVKETRSRK
jgi:ADA HAT complex component 1